MRRYPQQTHRLLAQRLLAAIAVQAALLALPQAGAVAADAVSTTPSSPTVPALVEFDIPSKPLFEALNDFSRQAAVPVTILPGTPSDLLSTSVRGKMSSSEALAKLLGNHSIPFRFVEGALIVGQASSTPVAVEVLPPATVVGAVPRVAIPTEGGSSGQTIIGEEAIKTYGTADKDPVRLLRILPNVNFSNSQYSVSSSGGSGTLSEQDLTPERISISGGKVYENKVMIDGLNNTSVLDVTSTVEGDADKIGINNPMALFANSDILKEVAVQDSNVSARYGGFTGGVVDMKTRDPAQEFGGSVGYQHESGHWVHYRNEGGAPSPDPRFSKGSYDASLDIPITEGLRSMVAASQVIAEQERTPIANYAEAGKATTRSTRSSYLGGVSADIGEETVVSVKGLYAPYSQEFKRGNMASDLQVTEGKNYSITSDLHHNSDPLKANLTMGWSRSGFERDAPNVGYTWKKTGSKSNICSGGTICAEGGFGDIADEQNNFQAKGDIGTKALGIDWTTGIDIDTISAKRVRSGKSIYYFNPLAQTNITCAADDPACIAGEQVLRSRNTYLGRNTQVDTMNAGYWAEGQKKIDLGLDMVKSLDLRAGVRADYGDALGNLNWAPRFSGTLNFPYDVGFTFGANRYYSTDNLVYKLYQNSPTVLLETRSVTGAGVVGAWSSAASKYQYVPADVRTPYSDERTVALTMPLLWGDGRAKYIVRRTRDEISETFKSSGGNITRTPNNNGWTNYKSASLEWEKSLRNHAFLINWSWSDTKRNNESYLETADDEDETSIYYKGSILRRGQLPMLASNFAQPMTINAMWTSRWLDDDLTLNITGKYRTSRTEIADTDRDISVGGRTYSIWDEVERNPQVRFDATVSYVIETLNGQTLTLTGYAENIFGARSYTASTSAPLEKGRAFWLGARYEF